ncbi:MAG: hypothetical protein ACPG5P_07125, partial [Saprospiraceae bacterium]
MNKNKLGVFLFFCLSMICIYSCKSDKPVEQKINITPKKITSPYSIQLDFDKIPFKYISDYGFFLGKLSDFIPNEKVLFYEPVSSLFSDKSHKSRFIWMPENTSATIKKEAPYEFDYPNGTVIIKNFYYPKNFNNPQGEKQVIETRLLIKKENKWEAYPYLWNEEQTDAKYKITGTTLPVSFIDEKGKKHDINYIQPNKNQCKSCHNKKEQLLPIGPKARNLNFKLDYGNGIL